MDTLVDKIQKYGVEYIGRYYSTYRAVVVENQDELYLSRLQVKIPGVLGGLLLWALPNCMYGTVGSGIRGPIPKIGEVVYITFDKGDPFKPYWSYHSWAPGEVPKDFKNTDTFGIITASGNKILISENNGTLEVQVQNSINIRVVNEDGKIIFNDGEVGVPESNKVTKQLNQIEKAINNLQSIIGSAIVTPMDGGASLLTSLKMWQPNLQETTPEDIESTQIFQKN